MVRIRYLLLAGMGLSWMVQDLLRDLINKRDLLYLLRNMTPTTLRSVIACNRYVHVTVRSPSASSPVVAQPTAGPLAGLRKTSGCSRQNHVSAFPCSDVGLLNRGLQLRNLNLGSKLKGSFHRTR